MPEFSETISTTQLNNLWRLVAYEFFYVEESFKAANRSMELALVKVSEARDMFNHLQETNWRGGDNETLLDIVKQLKKKVSYLIPKIPHNLISLSSTDQLTPNPIVNRRSRDDRLPLEGSYGSIARTENLGGNLEFDPPFYNPPTSNELETSLRSLSDCKMSLLRCYMSFSSLDNTVIKKSLLSRWWEVFKNPLWSSEIFDDMMDQLIEEGFILPVYKESIVSIASYEMHHSVRSSLNRTNYTWSDDTIYLAPAPIDESDIIHTDPQPFLSTRKLKVLQLGKWHGSVYLTQDIEVNDSESFFRGMEKLGMLEYVSFRGISMIIELPLFITKLKKLKVLDLKACHNLEVIPRDIYKLGQTLTHLDMSECYFLEHMPKTLSQLHSLCVLKGFFVGESSKLDSCTLRDLSGLSKIRKLSIYTNMQSFPHPDQLEDLQRLPSLRNLTISWGGCQTHKSRPGGTIDTEWPFSFGSLEKLDLQCVPQTVTRFWLNPNVFKNLKKLYIRGGQFFDLGQQQEEEEEDNKAFTENRWWTVEILRLRYLNKLKMDWREVERLFPKLIRLDKVECPNLTWIECHNDGTWVRPGKVLQLQIRDRTYSIR